MAIQDLRAKIKRMERREIQLIHLLQRAYTEIRSLSTLDTNAGQELDAEAAKILGPNWHQQGG